MKYLLCLFLACGAALAGPTLDLSLTFGEDGLLGEDVLDFYSPFGVTFSSGLIARPTVIVPLFGGPSAEVVAPSVIMNLDEPFDSVISFYYQGAGTVTAYSDLNAGGMLLASMNLPSDQPGATGALSPPPLELIRSVVFSRDDSALWIDSVSFGILVIPEPATALLLMVGLGVLLALRWSGLTL